ncbi:hypothetical protein [Streptomyces sp. NPDC048200]|uniref:hypothetical protein n=1 Tax=Streptomyces sp. NPDC048200 TaxID=3365512 RepID=UPI00371BA674
MAAQQIPIEDAFPIYRQRCSELFDENLILRAQVGMLERQLEALQQNASEPAPVLPMPGPDLAAQPPFEQPDRG